MPKKKTFTTVYCVAIIINISSLMLWGSYGVYLNSSLEVPEILELFELKFSESSKKITN